MTPRVSRGGPSHLVSSWRPRMLTRASDPSEIESMGKYFTVRSEFDVFIVRAETHGRYLVLRRRSSASVIVGFHGYGESADDQLGRLAALDLTDEWRVVSIQGLH